MTASSCTSTLKFMASGSGDNENPNNSTLDGEQQVMMRPNVPITQALPEGSDRQVLMNGVSGAVLRGPQDMDGETVAPSNSQRPLEVPYSASSSGVPVDGRPAGSHQTEPPEASSWGQVSLPPRGVMWILLRLLRPRGDLHPF